MTDPAEIAKALTPAQRKALQGELTGMTLRDWFAGQALSAMPLDAFLTRIAAKDRAKIAYMQADAMLAARAPDGVDGKGER